MVLPIMFAGAKTTSAYFIRLSLVSFTNRPDRGIKYVLKKFLQKRLELKYRGDLKSGRVWFLSSREKASLLMAFENCA